MTLTSPRINMDNWVEVKKKKAKIDLEEKKAMMVAAAVICQRPCSLRNYKTGNFTEMPTNMIGHSSSIAQYIKNTTLFSV